MATKAYKSAGVDVEAGYEAVKLMKNDIKRTSIPGVLGEVGGFGGMFELPKNMKNPILVSGTDGVGTKLKIASVMDKHDTVGRDCVAMCVNDIVCSGARPLFFLDYIALGKNVPERVASIVKGVADGCVTAGCALIGGETAEMPGFYPEDEYDLAGFCVGAVDKSDIIDGTWSNKGDKLIGIASSGVHSNGFSLIRKIFDLDSPKAQEILCSRKKELGTSLGRALLTPTKIYAKPILFLANELGISGAAHITGGGFIENVPRMLPPGLKAVIHKGTWEVLPIFKLIQKQGGLTDDEMYNTFNMGIGMVIVVNPKCVKKAIEVLSVAGEKAYVIGELASGKNGVEIVDDETGEIIK